MEHTLIFSNENIVDMSVTKVDQYFQCTTVGKRRQVVFRLFWSEINIFTIQKMKETDNYITHVSTTLI